jgi:hypothetical protein
VYGFVGFWCFLALVFCGNLPGNVVFCGNLPGNLKSMKCPKLEKDWPMSSRQNGTGNCQLPKRRKSSVHRELSPKEVIPFGSPKSAIAGGPDLVLLAGKREISRLCIEVAHNEQLLGAAWMHARGRTQRRGFLKKEPLEKETGSLQERELGPSVLHRMLFFSAKNRST